MSWSFDKMVRTSNEFMHKMLTDQARERKNGVEKEAASLAEGQQQGEQ